MEVIKSNTNLQANTKTTIEPVRPLANFPPSIWGDCFLSFSLDISKLEAYAIAIEEHKEELRSFITNPTIGSNEKLSFIYALYRLGLTYLFMKEIDDQLDTLFTENKMQDYVEVDLYTISIHFQVFRSHGYRFSCDVFNKFKDCSSGTFKEEIICDVRGVLSFYESAQLRIKGETILDEAFIFTESKLKRIENTLEGNLARQVKYALVRPFHRGMQIVEARMYLLNYEEECSTYGSLLKLAKVHFNYLQLLQKEELRIVSQWWKDRDILRIAPYSRDRIPELYLWILALFMEPHYSHLRIITFKMISFVVLLDDTYDAYATIDEIRLLTHAINRWDVSAIEQLPNYLKPLYKIFLNEFIELYEQQAKEGTKYLVDATKKACQKLARAYLQEAEWRHNKEVPLFEEYMKVGLITASYEFVSKSSLIGMGKIVTKEGFAWYQTHPKILKDAELIGRLHDDVSSFEFERKREVTATGVDAYMKTFGVSEEIAIKEVKKIIENTWKDIHEGLLKPRDVPLDLLAPILNLARMADVTYRYNDGFTFPEKIFKEYITLLFQVPVPI